MSAPKSASLSDARLAAKLKRYIDAGGTITDNELRLIAQRLRELSTGASNMLAHLGMVLDTNEYPDMPIEHLAEKRMAQLRELSRDREAGRDRMTTERWFVFEQANQFAPDGVMYGVQMGSPGNVSWRRSRSAAESELAALLATPACRECGDPTPSNYMEPTKSKIIARQLCFGCLFWNEVLEEDKDGRGIVMEGVHYRDGGRTRRASEANGFGGTEWRLRLANGRLIETNNLWCQGRIPEHFRSRLPDNTKRAALSTTEDPR